MQEPARKSFFDGLFARGRTYAEPPATGLLDEALQQLARALQDNDDVCAQVRKRQSSGSLKIVSAAQLSALEAE